MLLATSLQVTAGRSTGAGSGGERAVALCDWLDSVTLPDGGVPFALPVRSAAGCAPFWAEADPKTSSLQITAAVLGPALRVAELDPGVRSHRWLERASSYVVDRAAEATHALDFAPIPDRPVRELFKPEVMTAELDRLASRQMDDGGWPPEFQSYSPAAELEWRGYLTVYAVSVLIANRRATR